MTSKEAVEAAARASFQFMKEEPWEAASPDETDLFKDAARKALAAALPHMLHYAALEALARVTALAADWEDKGEYDIAYSKTVPDEDIAMALLTHGADMVENARLIRIAMDVKPEIITVEADRLIDEMD